MNKNYVLIHQFYLHLFWVLKTMSLGDGSFEYLQNMFLFRDFPRSNLGPNIGPFLIKI